MQFYNQFSPQWFCKDETKMIQCNTLLLLKKKRDRQTQDGLKSKTYTLFYTLIIVAHLRFSKSILLL